MRSLAVHPENSETCPLKNELWLEYENKKEENRIYDEVKSSLSSSGDTNLDVISEDKVHSSKSMEVGVNFKERVGAIVDQGRLEVNQCQGLVTQGSLESNESQVQVSRKLEEVVISRN